MTLTELRDALRAATGPDRRLADRVLLACGWRLNADEEEIAQAFAGKSVARNDDGEDVFVSYEDFANFSCWYPPGNTPYRDKWIGGHYRPDPTASIDAAVTLVPEEYADNWGVFGVTDGIASGNLRVLAVAHIGNQENDAATPALAICLARLEYEIAKAGPT